MTKYEGVTMAGKLVVVEGIDGCGKTTLVKNLVPKIEEADYKVCLPNEDLNFTIYRKAKTLFKDIISVYKDEMYVNDLQISLLALADLYNIKKKIQEELNRNRIVIMDRWYYSTMVYGTIDLFNKKAPLTDISDRLTVYKHIIKDLDMEPDVLIYLDADVDLCYQNVLKRYKEIGLLYLDTYESLEAIRICKRGYSTLIGDNVKPEKLIVEPIADAADYETILDRVYSKLIDKLRS